MKGKRLANEDALQRVKQGMALLTSGRKIASDTTEGARTIRRAKAAGDFLMDWNRGAARHFRTAGFPGAVPAPDKRLSPYRGALYRSFPF